MANDKTYDRHINIWINGKEVRNDASSIKKEMLNLTNEVNRATRGTKEYIEKSAELKKVKKILKEHQDGIAASKGAWDNLKGSFGAVMGVIGAGYGIIQSLKGIIESTDESSDKFARTMGGVKEAINAASQSMASSSFKDFLNNIRSAVDEGQRYADSQDSIGDSTRALTLEEQDLLDEILRLKIVQADATKSREEQIAAGELIEKKQAEFAEKRVEVAQKTLDNEMANARFRSKLSDEIIWSFLRQDEAMAQNMETGKKYYELSQQYNALTTSQLVFSGGKLKEQMNALGEDAPKWAAIYGGMSNVTEAQRDRIIAAEGAMRDAKRSATEDILRQITKLNTARAAEADEAARAAAKITDARKDEEEKSREQEMTAAKGYEDLKNDEKKVQEDAAAQEIEDEKRLFEEVDKINKEAADASAKYIEEDAKRKGEAADEEIALQKRTQEELTQLKQDFVLGIIGLGETLFDRQLAQLDKQYRADIKAAGDDSAAKKKIEEDYNKEKIKIQRKAAIAEKAAAIFTIAVETAKGVVKAIAGIVTAPLVPWIIATGAIQAAIVAAKPLPQFYEGGFSGHGRKYEPKGVVHSDEWIANAAMVASPVTGPIIRALEEYRVNSLPGYVNGGMAEGAGQRAQGTGQGALVATDPKLTAVMEMVYRLLVKLDQQGVKNIWPWSEIDNMRKGMNKLEDIEGTVS